MILFITAFIIGLIIGYVGMTIYLKRYHRW